MLWAFTLSVFAIELFQLVPIDKPVPRATCHVKVVSHALPVYPLTLVVP